MAKWQLFTETWDGNVINASQWTGTFGTVTSSGGAMNLVVNTGATNYSGIDSVGTYDLTSSFYQIQLVNGGNQSLTSLEVYIIQLLTGSTSKLIWYLNQNTLKCFKTVASVQTQVGSNLTYDSTLHKYFRIRELDGSIYWDYSRDGIGWTNQTSTATPITITALYSEPTAGTFGTEASGTTIILDNLNVIPGNGIRKTINSGLRPHPFSPGIAR